VILVALGGNLPHPLHGPPQATLEAVLAAMPARGILVLRRSRWYRSTPVPASDQPDFVNGVAAVATTAGPEALLARLHALEQQFGRIRGVRNAARVLDLDLIDHGGAVRLGPMAPILPHPRMELRSFVLQPLLDVAPGWRHPITGRPAEELLAAIPAAERAVPLR